MILLMGSLTIGLILSLLALGVYISFRTFNFPDITADGSFTLGAAVTAILVLDGVDPVTASGLGFLGGMLAGAATGILYAKCKIHGLLSGILVMTSLYSINLHIMGKSNVSLLSADTLSSYAERLGHGLFGTSVSWLGWEVMPRDGALLLLAASVAAVVVGGLHAFLMTTLGTAMRATGDNPGMIRALGADVDTLTILGLALSNGLIALSGALLAQYQGFADVQMGIGMVVMGLASVIIGEALIGSQQIGLTLIGAVMGAVVFRLLIAIALRWGLHPNDLKLITALFVFVALMVPTLLPKALAKLRGAREARPSHA